MSGINSLVNTIVDSMDAKTSKDTKPYDIRAEIRNIKDGVAWVHFPGGVDETPVDLTINANVGDVVQVRVSGGRAWITGNATSPPTDDRRANVAFYTANEASSQASAAAVAADNAQIFAESAQQSANEANEILDGMKEVAEEADLTLADTIGYAIEAHGWADDALDSAEAAATSASNAMNSAKTALFGLSNVEDVVGTVQWISSYGTYFQTTDPSVVSGKTYYTLKNGQYSIVPEPKTEDIGSYYELNLTDSVQNYIRQRLTVTEQGLKLTDGSSGAFVLISNGIFELTSDTEVKQKVYYTNTGTQANPIFTPVENPTNPVTNGYYEANYYAPPGISLWDAKGNRISKFGDDFVMGKEDGFHIRINASSEMARLSFLTSERNVGGSEEIAYISGGGSNAKLYIPRAVVVNSMEVGSWAWIKRSNDNLTLKWMGA